MNKWKVLETNELSDEQKLWFLPPKYSHLTSIIGVFIDVDEENCEWIIIGENSPENRRQAEIICKALNKNNIPPNPITKSHER